MALRLEFYGSEGAQNKSPRNMPLKHGDYFELKGIKTQKDSGKALYLPLNCLNLHWKGEPVPGRELLL